MFDSFSTIINMQVAVTNLQKALFKIIQKSQSKQPAYVCVSNVHMCMEVFDSNSFKSVVNQADLVLADGKPISWGQKLLGSAEAEQVRGQDIMNAICELSGIENLNVGFYGGSSDKLLKEVVSKLKKQYPDIQITYTYSPPFRPLKEDEDQQVIQDIKNADVNILFVGIGCPKQEIWMAEHKENLNCVMLGVGAAFDFIAGSKKHAPRWMQKLGLEWLFRLCSEPKRLWKRYLKQNPRFIYHFSKQLIKHKLKARKLERDKPQASN
ncbi:WecB/TagA/CpsF family glycosyltransferase [Thalassotalea psychrophila]|uniref:WecB/TagA/CpsF family glycosyltransferase n=1 Tax=Thalassotalea psychrophila TaxID=3065647 RepID=A0ABY9TQS8_9GAMM|nr:WecB/TagA/CpsF family glycosyltransferase [Colwelliaceae bacterium SQ149]